MIFGLIRPVKYGGITTKPDELVMLIVGRLELEFGGRCLRPSWVKIRFQRVSHRENISGTTARNRLYGYGGCRQADGLTHGGEGRCRQRRICGDGQKQAGCAGGVAKRALALPSQHQNLFQKSRGSANCGWLWRMSTPRGSHSENLRSKFHGDHELLSLEDKPGAFKRVAGSLTKPVSTSNVTCARPRGGKRHCRPTECRQQAIGNSSTILWARTYDG